MATNREDIKEDIKAATDRLENLQSMEPLVLSEGSRHRGSLSDLAVELPSNLFGRTFEMQSATVVTG